MWSSSSRSLSVGGPRGGRRTLTFSRGLFAVLLGIGLCLGVGGAIGDQAPRDEAESVLVGYFMALQTGDVDALGRILGGELRASMSGLLQNPEYGLDLVRDYGGAEFEVQALQVLDSGDAVATVVTLLPPSERLRHRLRLRRGESSADFQIVESEFIP